MPGYPEIGSTLSSATGTYRIDSLLGEGGMGAVFRAHDQTRNLPVAIKLTAPELRSRPGIMGRFANEATAASRIASEHVVKIIAVEATLDGTPFIVMELLEGRDLDAIIAQEGPLSIARAVHFGLQTLRALQVAHGAGVVHRDLKPSNVFVVQEDGDSDYVKLIDFGITKLLGDDTKNLTRTSATLGTPSYMAPEQAKNAKVADARSDLYSVGVILYEMLTKQLPFSGESSNEVLIKICTEPGIPILTARPDLPQGLASAIEHAMVKMPSSRYPSVDAFAAALRPYADARSGEVLSKLDGASGQIPNLASFARATPPTQAVQPIAKIAATPPSPPSPRPVAQAGTAMMAPMALAAPAVTPAPHEAQRTVLADPAPLVANVGAAVLSPARPAAGATVIDNASHAPVPYVAGEARAAPHAGSGGGADRASGGGRGLLLAVLGVAAVGLIGSGIYMAIPSRGSGASAASASSLDIDDGTGNGTGAAKKKKRADDDPAAIGDTTTTDSASASASPPPAAPPHVAAHPPTSAPATAPTTTATPTALPLPTTRPTIELPPPHGFPSTFPSSRHGGMPVFPGEGRPHPHPHIDFDGPPR